MLILITEAESSLCSPDLVISSSHDSLWQWEVGTVPLQTDPGLEGQGQMWNLHALEVTTTHCPSALGTLKQVIPNHFYK